MVGENEGVWGVGQSNKCAFRITGTYTKHWLDCSVEVFLLISMADIDVVIIDRSNGKSDTIMNSAAGLGFFAGVSARGIGWKLRFQRILGCNFAQSHFRIILGRNRIGRLLREDQNCALKDISTS